MNPVTVRYIRLTKNVSSVTIGLQRPFAHRSSRFQFPRTQLRFFTDTSKQHSDSNKQHSDSNKQHSYRTYSTQADPIVLKGDLGLHDSTRNKLYLIAALAFAALAVGGIYTTLNSAWFESNLRFDEKDPQQWPIAFMEFIALVGQMDRFSLSPIYTKKLLAGTLHEDEEIRRLSCSALGTLATDMALCGEIARSIDLPKILQSLRTAQSVELLSSVVDLMEVLSQRADNAPYLLNKQTIGVVEMMCHHPKDEIKGKVSRMLGNLSKNDEVIEVMLRLLPPMHTLYQHVDEYSKRGITVALRNVINSKVGKEKHANLYKLALTNAKIPEEELQQIKGFTEESLMVHRAKCVAAAVVCSSVYSGARWAIHGYGKGLRKDDLLSLLKWRTPRSALGAAGLYLYFAADDAMFSNVIEPQLNSEGRILSAFGTSAFVMVGVLWASQALAPFSFVPSVIYPMYKYWQDGDERYYGEKK